MGWMRFDLSTFCPTSLTIDIQLTMRYVILDAPKADESREIILKDELQKSLPVSWNVHETLEERFIFKRTGSYKPDEAHETS
jgi:hypothetical protein